MSRKTGVRAIDEKRAHLGKPRMRRLYGDCRHIGPKGFEEQSLADRQAGRGRRLRIRKLDEKEVLEELRGVSRTGTVRVPKSQLQRLDVERHLPPLRKILHPEEDETKKGRVLSFLFHGRRKKTKKS